jgi:DNA-binding NarL/FixJ family response regulator
MRALYDAQLAPVRGALGERAAAIAEASGRTMTFEAAIDEALAWLADSVTDEPPAQPLQADDPPRAAVEIARPGRLPAPSPAPAGSHAPHPLTRRELAVARLIAQGLTNRQIAAELVITEGTTSNYVQRVMGRLGFHARAQIAAWVAEHGLQEPSDDKR